MNQQIQSTDLDATAVTPDAIMQLGLAFWGSKALLSAVELGLFTLLANGPLSADVLTTRLKLHPRSVRDFLERAFERAGLDWSRYVRVDSGLIREDSRIPLLSDSRKARRELQWEPTTTFNDLVDEMVDSDRRLIK